MIIMKVVMMIAVREKLMMVLVVMAAVKGTYRTATSVRRSTEEVLGVSVRSRAE